MPDKYSATFRKQNRSNLHHKKIGELIAAVQDFGKGFDIRQQGMGITGMHERMKELGGELVIETGKNGTTVRALLPLSSRSV